MMRALKHPLVPSYLLAIGLIISPVTTAVADQFAGNNFSPTAFTECSAQAFLTQGSQSITYGLNLLSGDYNVASSNPNGDPVKLNAMAFNPQDRFAYGWSYIHGQPARIHSDWSVEPFGTSTNITNSDFYVGDVSISDNRYYVYRSGTSYGLYYFELDPAHTDYQVMQLVPNSNTMGLGIADFAFHPTNGLAYAVDSSGNLYSINASAGTRTLLGNTGETGTFGAAYFDLAGNLYIGRNQDGKIFRIAIDAGATTAEFFAAGPSASFNDGFRCAIAPVELSGNELLDFGDAPDSYGTSIQTNGARHGVPSGANTIRLGSVVDGESDAYSHPLTDNDNGVDEDGITFITSIVQHQTTRVSVDAPNGGILNAWIDVDRNGVFDLTDQVVTDQTLSAGQQIVSFTTPANLVEGASWARFRLSSVSGVEAKGGAPDGEVEDYPVNLLLDPVTVSNYPSRTGLVTVAFEDNWPFEGDYDMNDLVTQLRTTTYKDSRGFTRVDITGHVSATGAFYENGFGIRLPGVARADIDQNNLDFQINTVSQNESPLEAGRQEAIFIIAENVFDHVAKGPNCDFYRTEPGCGSAIEFSFNLTIPFTQPQSVQLSGVFDPFLFATPGAFHGAHFTSPPGRSYEIHVKNQAPTEAFDVNLFANVGQDATDPANNLYYLTNNGLPWALIIGDAWLHPREHVEISDAYPNFQSWATSNGTLNINWFESNNADTTLVFTE